MSIHGRHRAPGRMNPVASLSSAVVRGARPAMTVTAAVAAASGMVAGLVSTANAAPAAPAAVNAPAADAVALAASSTTKVSFGKPAVSGAAVKTATNTYAPVALTSRTKVAAPTAATTTTVRPATVRPATGATRTSRPSAARRAAVATYTPKRKVVAANPAPRAGVLGIAAGLSGIPYSWGGTSPAGFDCSGFTQYVFARAGVSLPRTAGAQRAAARYVSSPQPGDLVFFGTYHVGIYAGNGMMYDAPTSGQTTGLHRIWSSAVTYGRVG